MNLFQDPSLMSPEKWIDYCHEEVAQWRKDMCENPGEANLQNKQLQRFNEGLEVGSLYAFFMQLNSNKILKHKGVRPKVKRFVIVTPGKSHLLVCSKNEKIYLQCRLDTDRHRDVVYDDKKRSLVRVIPIEDYKDLYNLLIICRINRPFIFILKSHSEVYLRFFEPEHELTKLSTIRYGHYKFKEIHQKRAQIVVKDNISYKIKALQSKTNDHCYITLTAMFPSVVEQIEDENEKTMIERVAKGKIPLRKFFEDSHPSQLSAEDWEEYIKEEAKEWTRDMTSDGNGQLADYQLLPGQPFGNVGGNMEDMSLYAFCMDINTERNVEIKGTPLVYRRTVEVEPGRSYLFLCRLKDSVTFKCLIGPSSSEIYEYEKKPALVRVIAISDPTELESMVVITRGHREITVVTKARTRFCFKVFPRDYQIQNSDLQDIVFKKVFMKTHESEAVPKPFESIIMTFKLPRDKYSIDQMCYFTLLPIEGLQTEEALDFSDEAEKEMQYFLENLINIARLYSYPTREETETQKTAPAIKTAPEHILGLMVTARSTRGLKQTKPNQNRIEPTIIVPQPSKQPSVTKTSTTSFPSVDQLQSPEETQHMVVTIKSKKSVTPIAPLKFPEASSEHPILHAGSETPTTKIAPISVSPTKKSIPGDRSEKSAPPIAPSNVVVTSSTQPLPSEQPQTQPATIATPFLYTLPINIHPSQLSRAQWQTYIKEESQEWARDMCTGETAKLINKQSQRIPHYLPIITFDDMTLNTIQMKIGESKIVCEKSSKKTSKRQAFVEPGRSYLILCPKNERVELLCEEGNLGPNIVDYDEKTALVRIVTTDSHEKMNSLVFLIREHREVTIVVKNQSIVHYKVIPREHQVTAEDIEQQQFVQKLIKTESESLKPILFQPIKLDVKLPKKKKQTDHSYITLLSPLAE